MRKTAKFEVEIEYEDTRGDLTTEHMKIIKCESEGDFKGLTLALTTGLAFGAEKNSDDKEIFEKKVRLLRATGSALVNCLAILKNQGELTDDDVNNTLITKLGKVLKLSIDLITYGIAKVLKITDEDVKKLDNEYSDETKETKETKDGQESKQRGLESDDWENYL
jgi:hypothetical protein